MQTGAFPVIPRKPLIRQTADRFLASIRASVAYDAIRAAKPALAHRADADPLAYIYAESRA